jgi:hypothetical protein
MSSLVVSSTSKSKTSLNDAREVAKTPTESILDVLADSDASTVQVLIP